MARPINADMPKAPPPQRATTETPPRQQGASKGREGPSHEAPAKAEGRTTPPPARARTAPPATRAPSPPRRPRPRRQPIPAALKAIAGLFLLAVVFIVAAVLGGGSSEDPTTPSGPAPAPVRSDEPAAEAPAAAAEDLGFPAFATSNTTRVGGADAASNAAGVALAVYPSTEEALRPSAVTLVDPDAWQASIAAAVLMAEPVRAPLLFGDADGLPEPSAEALEALDPRGGGDSGGAQLFAVGDVEAPGDLEAKAVKPTEPAAAAAAVARLRDRLSGRPPRHIVLAPLSSPDFAAPAAAWAARSGDPVLFSGPRKLPAPTRAYLRRHAEVPVYVLGPSSVIPSDLVRQIAKLSDQVSRVSGEDPIANAIAFARYDDGDFGWNVNDPGHGFVVARSDSPLDAVAAAPLSASGTWGPLLLTDGADTLPEALRGYLLDVKPGYTTDPTRAFYNHVWVIGDEDAIGVNQQAEIDALAELAKIGGEP
jgi:ell wall binding domain 2 (CWB2)